MKRADGFSKISVAEKNDSMCTLDAVTEHVADDINPYYIIYAHVLLNVDVYFFYRARSYTLRVETNKPHGCGIIDTKGPFVERILITFTVLQPASLPRLHRG